MEPIDDSPHPSNSTFMEMLTALVAAALGAHVAHGVPCTFSWALVHDVQLRRWSFHLSPSHPDWRTRSHVGRVDTEGVEKARAAIEHVVAHLPSWIDPPQRPKAVPWEPGSAHARIHHARLFATIAASLPRSTPSSTAPERS